MSSLRASLAVFLIAVALLAVGIVGHAWPFLADDAFISLRFAERFVAGHGLTWTDGERVEGYSNLAWILLTALLHGLGCDWITACRVLGISCTVATFAVFAFGRLLPNGWPANLALATVAMQASVAVWAIGGLETPLVLLLVSVTMLGLARGLGGAPDSVHPSTQQRWLGLGGAALALAAWTRPDGPLWAVIAGATVLLTLLGGSGPRSRRGLAVQLALLLGPAVAAVVLQLAFRLVYYGEWLPNTAHAKVSSWQTSLPAGLDYLWSAATSLRSILIPALLGLLLGAGRRPTRVLWSFAALSALVWSLYVLRVGGDVFPRNRMVVPVLAPLTVLAALGITRIWRTGTVGRITAWLLVLTSITLAFYDAIRHDDDPRQQPSRWEWAGAATGTWLGRAFAQQQPLLAVDAAGAVPFSSKLPCLDMLGLCDKTIARTPVSTETFIAGHNRGNGAYVLSRRPDIVLFGVPPGSPQPRWLSGVQMEVEPSFLVDYRVVLFETGDTTRGDGTQTTLRITAWVRREGKVGPMRSPERIVVPGFWLGCYRQPFPFRFASRTLRPDEPGHAELMQAAKLGAEWWQAAAVVGVFDAGLGRVVAAIRRPGRHSLPQLAVPAGHWRLSCDGMPAGVTLSLLDAQGRECEHDANGWRVDATEGTSPSVELVCSVPESSPVPFSITDIVLLRSE